MVCYQVAPAELEDLLVTHPEISDAAVIPYVTKKYQLKLRLNCNLDPAINLFVLSALFKHQLYLVFPFTVFQTGKLVRFL